MNASSENSSAYGLQNLGATSIKSQSLEILTSAGGNAYTLYTDNGTTNIESDDIQLNASSDTGTAWTLSTLSTGTTDIKADNILMNASSESSSAYGLQNLGTTSIKSQSIGIAATADSTALGVVSSGDTSNLVLDSNEIDISATASSQAMGLVVRSGSSADLGNSSSNITVNAESSNASINEGGSIGIFALGSDSSIVINGTSLTVDSSNSENGLAYGIYVGNNTQNEQTPDNAASIVINSENTTVKSSDLGLAAYSNGQMEINGNLSVEAEKAIEARGYSTININKSGENTIVLNGDIVFGTPNVEGGDSNNSGNIIDAYVNVNLSGENSSWTGRSYQTYSYKDDDGNEVAVETSVIGENSDYHGQVSVLSLTVRDGATITTTGDSFANVLNMDSGNMNLADISTLYANDFSVAGDSNTINLGSGADISGTINDTGTLYLTGDTDSFTGALNVFGKASIGLTADEASEALSSTDGSVLVIKAGSALNGAVAVGSSASAASADGSSLSVLSDGTLAIVATDDYTEGTALVTVDTASTESGSTVKLVNAVKIADGTTVFSTTDDSSPSEYTLVTDNLLKVVENNQIVSQSASVALTGVLAPNTVNEALTASGLGAERVIALTTDTTADSAVKALNSIALMATAGAAQVVSVNASNMIADTLDQHGSLLASYSHDKSGADLWVNLNGSFSKSSGYKAGSSSYGYKSDLAGATIGADYAFGNGVTAGAAFSIGTGSARGQGNGSGVKNDIDYWGVNLYGVWTTPYVNLIGNVGYLQTKNEISQSGYKGKPDVKTISVGVKAEKALQLNESITVTPHIGVRYFNVDMDSFTAGGFKYSSDKANLVQVPFGVAFNANLKTSCGAEVKPFIDVQIAPAFGDRRATNKFALAGGSASDSIEARIANNAVYSAKVGVEATQGNHSFGLNYGIASGNYGRVDQALQAKYRYSF
ncbi:autotransporter domain-containing protein [Parasutterella excrementihominis]|uniref:autotransporter family protein n=1 Tax=Parasutterella excrementihominis TaxID=487175 RepID=UPI003AB66543